MNQWNLCYFQHILQSHPRIVLIGGFFYFRYASNTQFILFVVWLLVLRFKRHMFDKNRVTKSDFMCNY